MVFGLKGQRLGYSSRRRGFEFYEYLLVQKYIAIIIINTGKLRGI